MSTLVAPRLGALGPNGLPVPTDELGALDPDAVSLVLDQVRPRPRNADELHDLLLSLVACRPVPEWAAWFDTLVTAGRAACIGGCWVATEQRTAAEALREDDEARCGMRRRPSGARRTCLGR